MTPYIVSFRRSGTHALAALLYRNLHIDVYKYDDLHYSHSKTPDQPYVCVWRSALAVMQSMYRMRQRFGVAEECTFTQMLHQPWDTLPKAQSCSVTLNGELRNDVHPLSLHGTVLEAWANDVQRFALGARVVVQYNAIVEQPELVLSVVAQEFTLNRRTEYVPIDGETVGWRPNTAERVDVSLQDLRTIRRMQYKLRAPWTQKAVWTA